MPNEIKLIVLLAVVTVTLTYLVIRELNKK